MTNPLNGLMALAGSWRGTSRLQNPQTATRDESLSTLRVQPVIRGRFGRVDYTWGFRGSPHEGSVLIGWRADTGKLTAHWADSWHTGDAVMACEGSPGLDGTLAVEGTYAAPPGPDWGWRIEIGPEADGGLRLRMFNLAPEGREELVVEAHYVRSGSGKSRSAGALAAS